MAVGGQRVSIPLQTTNENYVWNSSSLAWEAMEQPAFSAGDMNIDIPNPLPVSGTFWQATQPVSGQIGIERSSTATVTPIDSNDSNITLQTATASRIGLTIFNDSTYALYVKFGTTASTTDFTVKILAGGYFELPFPCYTGRIDGIWAGVNGHALITEMT